MQKAKSRKQKAKNPEEVTENLLKNRGIKTKKQRERFFNPPHPETLSAKDVGIDPLQLNKAVKRIKLAINNEEKIIVYGDYDVDGVCAAAILWETLRGLGANALPYIPSRFSEGYGLNIESIKGLKEDHADVGLIITVDNGIVANEKVDFAKSLGVDVIITDHHIPGDILPKAYAIVHTTQMSGSSVAWFLSRELLARGPVAVSSRPTSSRDVAAVARRDSLRPRHPSQIEDHLGLAALGTVADVLPLVGHNRAIVKHGLEVLRKSNRIGLKTLCAEAGIAQDTIDTFHIGFVLAPRLNAMGRLEHAMDALRLLCTTDSNRASTLANLLGKTNKARQEKTEYICKHIEENFAAMWSEKLPGILFVGHEDYEEGVVGIVAGRLVEKYYRPSIVFSKGEKNSKGSARSINSINIIEVIRKAGEGILSNAGGHPMAAGFSLVTEKIAEFEKRLLEHSLKFPPKLFVRQTKVDCEVDFSLLTEKLYREILKFAPFGFGNPTPVFSTHGVQVEEIRLMGKENSHIKLVVSQPDGVILEAVGFRMGELYSKLSVGSRIDITYCLEENIWNGRSSLQLKLKSLECRI